MGRAQARETQRQGHGRHRITVRNASAAPIARLQIAETWYDKAGAIVTAGRGVINGLLQPGEIDGGDDRDAVEAGMTAYNGSTSTPTGRSSR